jgi:hypothetical protein
MAFAMHSKTALRVTARATTGKKVGVLHPSHLTALPA